MTARHFGLHHSWPRRARPWLWVAAASVLTWLLAQDRGPGDPAADFAHRRVEQALAGLSRAWPDRLPEGLGNVNWWPRPRRADALAALRATPADDLLESQSAPTIIEPLDRYRTAPASFRFRDPLPADLVFELVNIDLDLPAATVDVSQGALSVAPGVALLPGTRYSMTLRNGRDGEILALAGFEWLAPRQAEAAGIAMATAHELGGAGPGGELLASLVAMHHGLHAEARARLATLESLPAFATVARELRALALLAQGLDLSAQRLLDG